MSTIYDGFSTIPVLAQIPNPSHCNINHDGLSSLLRYYVTTRIRYMPYLPPFNVIIADIMSVDDIYHLP